MAASFAPARLADGLWGTPHPRIPPGYPPGYPPRVPPRIPLQDIPRMPPQGAPQDAPQGARPTNPYSVVVFMPLMLHKAHRAVMLGFNTFTEMLTSES